MAQKEIYRLDIKVGVSGDSESKNKLTAVEKMTQQIEKRTKTLDKLSASPSIKIKDNSSDTINKLKSKTAELNRTKINPSVRITDNASNRISQISSNLKRLESENVSVKLRINDQSINYLNKVKSKNDNLKDININPTAKASAESLSKHSSELNNTKKELMDLDGEFKSASIVASRSLDTIEKKAKSSDKEISNIIDDAGKSVTKIGDKISKVGDNLSTKVTLPIIGAGIAAAKIGMDFDSQMSRVKAISGSTGKEFEKLHDQALQLGADTAFSAKQAAEGMENLASAGFSTNEIMSAMPGLLDLAASSGESLASSSDIAASTLRGFGLAASDAGHVADVLAKNASATNAAVVDTGEAMKYIAPVAQTAGWSLESVAASIGELANSGIKGSQAGTTLRAMFSRLAKPSDESATAMERMGFKAYDAQHKMKSLSQIISDLSKSTEKMTDEQKQHTIAQVFGEEAMSGILTLIKNGSGALDDLTNSYKNSDGAAKGMAKTMQDNAKSAIEQMTGSLETAAIKIEEAFAPKITEAANYVQDLANKFSKLSPEQQDFYVKMALGAAAIGPIIKLIGGVTSAIGGLITVGSKVGAVLPALFTPAGIAIAGSIALIGTAAITESNLMKKSITTTTEELGPLERVMNELNGHLNKSKKEMVDLGLIYDDFGDDVSDNFKKNAKDASKSLLKLEMNINRLTKSDKFDDANNNQLKNWANDMAYEGINAIKEKQSKVKSELQKTFSLDGVTSAAEQGTLDYMDKFFGEGVNRELEIRNEMYDIGDKAIKDHGKLLEDDIKQLKEKAAELQQIKLEYANAESAGEQAYARSKFKSAAERVTGVDGASELLQNRAKEHQEAISNTNANYEKTIAITKTMLNNPNLSAEDRSTLENQLKETTAARDKGLKQAEDAWKSDLETLYQAYPKAKGLLNEDTGVQFSNSEIKSRNTMDKIQQSHSGLENITKSGVYALENNTTHDLETLYVSIDETTGKIKGLLNGANGEIGAYSDSEKEKLLSLKNEYSNTGATLQSLASTHIKLNNDNKVFNGPGSIIGELKNIQTAADGTKAGILDMNGTPCIITADINGAITSIQKVDKNLDNINGRVATALIKVTSTTSDIESLNEEKFFTRKNGYATGTNNATPGIHPVAENGFEIVYGKQNRLFQGGEKVLNHQQSKSFLQNQHNPEPFQVKQGQYQLAQPQQVQLAGVGGNNIQVDVQVNGSQDVEGIIVEVTQEVGRKIRDAFSNVKK